MNSSVHPVCWIVFCACVACILQGCGMSHDQGGEQDASTFLQRGPAGDGRHVAKSLVDFQHGNCSKKADDCKETGCCQDSSLSCFRKDEFFASCRADCTPGGIDMEDPVGFRTPWTCELVPTPTLEPLKLTEVPAAEKSCAAEHNNCSFTACCSGLSCYEKDNVWAGCRKTCEPGIDPTDPPDFQTPWTCKFLGKSRAPVAAIDDAEETMRHRPKPSATTTTTKSPDTPLPAWLQTHCAEPSSAEGPLRLQGVPGDAFAQGGGGRVSNDSDSITLHHNSGYSLMTTCRASRAPGEILQLKLLGRTINFQVDLSRVGCACNLAFYLVSGPALDPAGVPSEGECHENPYYCDANKVCGQWCPEVDIMEANNRVFQATPHKCDPPSSTGHYSSCDRNGCAQNTKDTPGSYGPGPDFTINTFLPFNVSTAFQADGETLTGMITTLKQGGRETVLDHASCDPGYLAQLSAAMQTGMSLRMTYWGEEAGTMAWMDAGPCGEETCSQSNAGDGVISGISVVPPQDQEPIRHIPGVEPLPPPAMPRPRTRDHEVSHPAFLTWARGVLLFLISFCFLGYAAAVAVLWRFPSLGPKDADEPICEWMSLLTVQQHAQQPDGAAAQAAPELPQSAQRELTAETQQSDARSARIEEVTQAVRDVNQLIRSVVRSSIKTCSSVINRHPQG